MLGYRTQRCQRIKESLVLFAFSDDALLAWSSYGYTVAVSYTNMYLLIIFVCYSKHIACNGVRKSYSDVVSGHCELVPEAENTEPFEVACHGIHPNYTTQRLLYACSLNKLTLVLIYITPLIPTHH